MVDVPGVAAKISIHALREEGDELYKRACALPIRISIHALREEGDVSVLYSEWVEELFLSTPSARRATSPLPGGPARWLQISIHALREEGDHRPDTGCPVSPDFYPRPPRGGRRTLPDPQALDAEFLSTPSARRATCLRLSFPVTLSFLSTPSARRATAGVHHPRRPAQISIHALREEGDIRRCRPQKTARQFLSTPSARRATVSPLSSPARRHFYPRPPRGGRRKWMKNRIRPLRFLSTPSARRATRPVPLVELPPRDFYPRPPRGGRPDHRPQRLRAVRISIHALREEGDRDAAHRHGVVLFISIHALREEGDSARCPFPHAARPISIHALREEGDPTGCAYVAPTF